MLKQRFSVLAIAAVAVFSLGSLTDRALAQERQGDVESDGQGDVTLKIQGDKGARFSGACSLGEEQRESSGRAPRSFEFDLKGRELSCEIGNQEGQSNELEVVLSGENVRSVQRLDGGQGTLKMTYDGNGSFSSMSSSSQTTVGGAGDSSLSRDEEKVLEGLEDRIKERVDEIFGRVMP